MNKIYTSKDGSLPKVHDLKTNTDLFDEVFAGRKKFDIRKNDRDFKVKDVLHLKEWDPEKKEFTGNEAHARVDFILSGEEWGIMKGYVVMSIRVFSVINTGVEILWSDEVVFK